MNLLCSLIIESRHLNLNTDHVLYNSHRCEPLVCFYTIHFKFVQPSSTFFQDQFSELRSFCNYELYIYIYVSSQTCLVLFIYLFIDLLYEFSVLAKYAPILCDAGYHANVI
uniref:Ovule protein n=1 Tax=Heterorhabditis bacteriophora TaxID=37862 RepID=A0A1I7W9H9_HETBA